MADLFSTAEYNAYAGTSYASTAATVLPVMAALISKAVRRYCGRDLTTGFEAATWTQTYDGNGSDELQLSEWPVASITSIAEIDNAGNSTTVVSTTYRPTAAKGIVSKLGALSGRFAGAMTDQFLSVAPVIDYGPDAWGVRPNWSLGVGNYSVVYVTSGGVPEDVKYACYRMADIALSLRRVGVFVSERIGDYQYTIADANRGLHNEEVRGLLSDFRRGGM